MNKKRKKERKQEVSKMRINDQGREIKLYGLHAYWELIFFFLVLCPDTA